MWTFCLSLVFFIPYREVVVDGANLDFLEVGQWSDVISILESVFLRYGWAFLLS